MLIHKIKRFLSSGDERSQKAKRNIILSFANKSIAILISLAIVPITIDYLNSEQYGVWLTLSSVVAWISFFDVGLGHGFRNKFAEAKANGNIDLAKKYVSTAYFALVLIFGVVLILFEMINSFLDWASILNISQDNQLLSKVVSIILIGVCASFSMNIFPIMLSADQKPAASAMISTVGQGCALLVIYILTMLPQHNMVYIAIALSWIPVMVTLLFSLWMFKHSYKVFSPSVKAIDLSLIKNIVSLGVKFFVIQVSMILIFQVVNVILSRVLGPSSVTEYNVAYKYFSLTIMAFNIILSPYWSAFTEAYTLGDFVWMINIKRKLTIIWGGLFCVGAFLLVFSPIAYDLWLGGSVDVSLFTSISMFIYINVLAYSTMHMVLLNGIGKVYLQMIIYIVCAVVSLPLSYYLCGVFGIPGVIMCLSVVYLIQAIFAKIQLAKILDNRAVGIWNK